MASDYLLKTIEKLGVIRENKSSTIELRITEVNGEQLYDIRSWYESNGEERATKGVRLSDEEMESLFAFWNEAR